MTKQLVIALSLFVFCSVAPAQEKAPDFQEVLRLLRENSDGLSEAELNRAAVDGMLEKLRSRVVLVTNAASTSAGNRLGETRIFDNAFVYLRLPNIESGLSEELSKSAREILGTNKLKGVVLDLRYASGTDYRAAADCADLFINKEQLLLRWGDATARSTASTNDISVPVTVLINGETSGAAEALAGVIQQAQIGLVLGANTAGQASVFKEFQLESGHRLKIASAPVELADGKTIPATGLKPDIDVSVAPDEEKLFYNDPYRSTAKTATLAETNVVANTETNRPRRRLNEADLVRMRREGIDAEVLEQSLEPAKPMLTDPALVRALDLLKGLAVVQQQSRRN